MFHTLVIYSFLTLTLCQFPITFSTSKFPKVTIINSPIFYLIIGQYLDQWFPTEAEQAFRDILKIWCHNNLGRR